MMIKVNFIQRKRKGVKFFMKKLLNSLYHLMLLSFIVLGVLYLGEMPPFDELVEDEKTGTAEISENTEVTPDNVAEGGSSIYVEKEESDMKKEEVEMVEETESGNQGEIEVCDSEINENDKSLEKPDELESENMPNYLAEREALQALSDAVVTNTAGYNENFNSAGGLNVFAEAVTNSFSFRTLSWYNLWSNNIQDVVFNAGKLSSFGDEFSFMVGIASGGTGTVKLQIFFNEEKELPEYECTLDAEQPPIHCKFDISEKNSLKILVNNCSSDENTVVFYDLFIGPREV